jgi:hypothetical protein
MIDPKAQIDTLKSISLAGSALLADFSQRMKPLTSDLQSMKQAHATQLQRILAACDRTGETTLLLVAHGRLWDAELPLRATMEGSVKFSYILQDPAHFDERITEYSDVLRDLGSLKNHDKACDFLASVSNPDSLDWKPIRDSRLSTQRVQEIKTRYPSNKRGALESKWGFIQLLKHLASSDVLPLVRIAGLAHGYGVASHVQHADCFGVEYPLSQGRHPAAFVLAHAARIVIDVPAYSFLRLGIVHRFLGHELRELFPLRDKLNALMLSFKDLQARWYELEYGKSATT